MKKYSIYFCDFFLHDNGILEIIIHEDVEMTGAMTQEYFDFIESIKPKTRKFLVNRINKYSYTFKASMLLAMSKLPEDVAIVKYNRLPWPLKGVFTPKFYHLAFFDNRDKAIKWLLDK